MRLSRTPSLAIQSMRVLAHRRGPEPRRRGRGSGRPGRAWGTPEWCSADQLPLVVEHRGAGRPGLGVGAVVEEVVEQVDDLVVAQGDLLGPSAGVLDDVDELLDKHWVVVLPWPGSS